MQQWKLGEYMGLGTSRVGRVDEANKKKNRAMLQVHVPCSNLPANHAHADSLHYTIYYSYGMNLGMSWVGGGGQGYVYTCKLAYILYACTVHVRATQSHASKLYTRRLSICITLSYILRSYIVALYSQLPKVVHCSGTYRHTAWHVASTKCWTNSRCVGFCVRSREWLLKRGPDYTLTAGKRPAWCGTHITWCNNK